MLKRTLQRAVPIGAAVAGMLGLVVGVGATPSSAAPKQPGFTTVATGFDNPRGLSFGEDGQLFVGEAGKGGPSCLANAGPDGGDLCVGLTSAISVITDHGAHHRVVWGLPSFSGDGGFGATGIDGVSFLEDGALYGIITGCPQQIAQAPANAFNPPVDPKTADKIADEAGQLIKVTSPGHYANVAPVGKVDWNWTLDHQNLVPPQQYPDCNPYGVLALGTGNEWVVDAAANTLDHIENGHVDIEKFIPNPATSDAVPTCLAKGPDGALYIGELTGGGNGPGAATVWRFDPRTEDLDQWATGLTAVVGCGFGPGGKFYATEFSTTAGGGAGGPGTGAVVQVPPHSTSPIVVASGLSFPNGFAARGNDIYVSNWSISIANPPPGPHVPPPGEVVKIHVRGGGDQGDDD